MCVKSLEPLSVDVLHTQTRMQERMDLLIESAVVAKPTAVSEGSEPPLNEPITPLRRHLSSLSETLSLCRSSTAETFVERLETVSLPPSPLLISSDLQLYLYAPAERYTYDRIIMCTPTHLTMNRCRQDSERNRDTFLA